MNRLFLLLAIPQPPSGGIDFARDVRPILQRSCVECHGAALAEADLRLDLRERFLSGGASGRVAVPGTPARAFSTSESSLPTPRVRMPWYQEPLAAGEIDILRRWIDEGASWPASSPSAPGTPLAATRGSMALQPGRASHPRRVLLLPRSRSESAAGGPAGSTARRRRKRRSPRETSPSCPAHPNRAPFFHGSPTLTRICACRRSRAASPD